MKLIHLFENEVPNITDPEEAYWYAINNERRIPELEPVIMKDPYWAVAYADNVINGRWPEAEPHIKKDLNNWEYYLNHYPEAEPRTKDVPLVLCDYIITDIPNTVTDEQLVKLIQLKFTDAVPNKQLVSSQQILSSIKTYRMYSQELIKTWIATDQLKNLNLLTADLLTIYKFLNNIDVLVDESDFS